jgi:large subunit ribosomal protein L20
MARVKTGFVRRKRHKKVLKFTKGQFGTRSKLYRRANEARLKSLWYAYRDRRNRKRDLRRLWIARINAAAHQNGTKYSHLMHGMKQANIKINRKLLADMAVRDPKAFTEVVKAAKAS